MNEDRDIKHGHIWYKKPTVTLLNDGGFGVAEVAARTCYNSFDSSENDIVRMFPEMISTKTYDRAVDNIEHSELLDQLSWVHHHHSIIEHASLSFLIHDTSRGVLQEHSRHRLQNQSVRSTRYTMSSVMNAYAACVISSSDPLEAFSEMLESLNILITTDIWYNKIEYKSIFEKLNFQRAAMGDEMFWGESVSKSSLPLLKEGHDYLELYSLLQAGKNKRNVGDLFKHIVSDNWKVDMVVTFNLRSLKNYFNLRDSGAAWFQIQWLAKEMKRVTPVKYLRLIDKEYRVEGPVVSE